MNQRGIALGWMYLIGAAAVIALLAGIAYTLEHRGYERGKAEVQAEWNEAVDKEARAELDQSNTAVTNLEKADAKAKVVYRTITQTVDKLVMRDVYRNVCLDTDGLLNANAALSGALTPTSNSDRGVSQLDSIGGRDRGGGTTETR